MSEIAYLILTILGGVIAFAVIIVLCIAIYDRFFQRKFTLLGNYPFAGRFRYVFHELRPLFRQYFGDDDAMAPRIIIDWILHVSEGKSGYFAFDKFDTTQKLHDGTHQMVHSPSAYNMDEMEPVFPIVGKKRKFPLHLKSYFYRSAMSLGSLSFEATSAMAKGSADAHAPFNTGEGGLAIHHLPNLKFSYDKKYLKYKKLPKILKPIYYLLPGIRLKNRFIEFLGNHIKKDMGERDSFLFNKDEFLLYKIDWDAPLEAFPSPQDLIDHEDEFGHIILQVGSGLYGMREKRTDGKIVLDWDRFAKTSSFVRAIEIKLAQGAKQTGGILKGMKNTHTISEIRGVHEGIDLISPNRFPFLERGKMKEFYEFLDKASDVSGGKPVGFKIVISDESNIEPFAEELAKTPIDKGPDFITIDGGDGGSGAAPIALGVLFGKTIYDALEIAGNVLKKHGVRDRVKIFASSKLYAPHMSARALALGADAVGNARSIMIAGGCIRAGRCSGEEGPCPVGMATMLKGKRRAYEQAWDEKVHQITNYIKAHNKGLIQVAAVAGVKSPCMLGPEHVMKS